jgi:hypothetical protein
MKAPYEDAGADEVEPSAKALANPTGSTHAPPEAVS